MMDPALAQTPFSALSFIAAPALLTNTCSLLALSTTNRLLQTRNRMHELYKQPDPSDEPAAERVRRLAHVARVELQGRLLLLALHAIYTALAAFAGATLVTLLGASLASFYSGIGYRLFVILGLVLGCVGVGGLMLGSWRLFRATQISLVNMEEEAMLIRKRCT